MIDISSLRKSKSFCPYPWVHSTGTTTGTHRLCCMIPSSTFSTLNKDGKPYKLGRDSISDIWNSDDMKNVRVKMLNGDEVPHCKVCMYDEKIGKPSQRNYAFNLWENNETLKENVLYSLDNNGEVKHLPISYDLRLGNLCNLKCRMCYPSNSTQIAKENKTLNNSNFFPTLQNLDHYSWYESDKFWNEFMENSKHIKLLKVAGGEPMINDNFYKFIYYLVENKLSKNIQLHINTNITTVPDKFINVIDKFEKVKILPSIDGIGLVDEYIRFPSKWNKIQKNFDKLFDKSLEVDNLFLNVHSTIQIYNIFNIRELIEWSWSYIEKNPHYFQTSMSFVSGKKFLDINILPDNMKDNVCIYLNNMKKDCLGNSLIQDYISSILNHIQTNPDDTDKHLKDFVLYTNTLDKSRNQNISDYIPQLSPLMEYQ